MRKFLLIFLYLLLVIKSQGQYYGADIMALQAIDKNCDKNNTLNWNTFTKFDEYVGITWSDDETSKRVKYIDISNKQLSNYLDLRPLTELLGIDCSHNNLNNIWAIDLPKLKEIIAHNNSLSVFQDLTNLPSLWHLDLAYNNLMEIRENLGTNCPNLRELLLNDNPNLVKLDLTNLRRLTKVNLNYCSLIELTGDYLENNGAEYFYCSSNKLTKINGFDGISKFGENVNFYGNHLPFTELAKLPVSNKYSKYQYSVLGPERSSVNNYTLDYSNQANINGNITIFRFYKNAVIVEENNTGIYNTTGPGRYNCVMTNPYFPGLSLYTYNTNVLTPEISLNDSVFNFNAIAGNKATVNITSNFNWTVDNTNSWLELSSSSGSKNGTFTVTSLANTSTDTRTGIITISGMGLTKTISVTQLGTLLKVKPEIIIGQPDGSKGEIIINSNVNWELKGIPQWLSLPYSSGNGNDTLIITASANTGFQRSINLTLSGNGNEKPITIKQQGPVFKVSSDTLVIESPFSGSKVALNLLADFDWIISIQDSWLKVDKTSGSKNAALELTTNDNTNGTKRNTLLQIIGQKEYSQMVLSVFVVQKGPELSVVSNSLVFGADIDTLNLEILSNMDWKAVSIPEWIKVSDSISSLNKTIYMVADPNPDTSKRTSEMILISSNATQRRRVQIVQKGIEPVLLLDKNRLIMKSDSDNTYSIAVTANYKWSIESKIPSWLSVSKIQGNGPETVVLSAGKNNSDSIRQAVIEFVSGRNIQKLYVFQANSQLNISETSLYFDYRHSTREFHIYSDTSWTISSTADWLKVKPELGKGNSSILVEVNINTSESSRNNSIIIKCGDLELQLEVFQDGKKDINSCNLQEEKHFRVYPNLCSDYITIESDESNIPLIAKIITLDGKTIMTLDINSVHEDIDVSGIREGMYILAIQGKNNYFTLKFIKQ